MTNRSGMKLNTLQTLLLGLGLCFLAGPLTLQAGTSDGTKDALKHSASYKRDPFWPVGHISERVKKQQEEKEEPKVVEPTLSNDWNKAMRQIAINGVSSRSSNEFYAIINGRVKSVGDTVTVKYEGIVYTWAVEKITPPGSVKLRRVSAR